MCLQLDERVMGHSFHGAIKPTQFNGNVCRLFQQFLKFLGDSGPSIDPDLDLLSKSFAFLIKNTRYVLLENTQLLRLTFFNTFVLCKS